MLKGIPTKNVDYSTEIGLFTASKSVTVKTLSLQDTSKTVQSKPQQLQNQLNLPKISINSEKSIDSIFAKNDLREKQIRAKNYNTQLQTIPKTNARDSTSSSTNNTYLPFHHKGTIDEFSNNFLLGISHKNISQKYDTSLLPHQKLARHTKNNQIVVEPKPSIVHEKSGFEGNPRAEASLDWLPFALLISLFIFSWIKVLYQKYVIQVVASIINYQVSIRLLRERNVLFRNMALGLNFIFAINIGLFIFYILEYRDLKQIIASSKFFSVIIYSFGIIILYSIKTFLCKILGNIFMVKEQFSEYVHNIHLYNKNIGLFLFPIIILFPYITNDQIKPFVIYFGLAIVICMSLLLVYRGFQIIMRNGVSIFYLILYLCAIEILPVLLLIKYSYTMI